MKYDHYTLEDFLTDDYFLTWVKHPTTENTAFWSSWLKTHPEKAAVVEEARTLIRSLDFHQEEIAEDRIAQLQLAIHQRINQGDYVPNPVVFTESPSTHQRWYWLAASIVLVVGSLLFFFYQSSFFSTTVTASSGYGQTKTVWLPDSSRVTLNANSTLSYEAGWDVGDRTVLLEGEAFFEVRKRNAPGAAGTAGAPRKFIVQTAGINIEVLGTTFNVLHRRGHTEVVLNTGQVRVVDTQVPQEVTMVPGEMVKVNDHQLVKNRVDPAQYTAWKENQLMLKSTPLGEIAQLLQDNYNYQVVIESDRLKLRTFTGTFPADDIQVLLHTLGKSLDVKVNQHRKEIFFSNKE